jgi:CIC family chloride channel protein
MGQSPASREEAAEGRQLSMLSLSLLSLLTGVLAGLGAVAFRGLIALLHNLFFLGRLSFIYDVRAHTPASPWGPLVMLAPVAGAAGVAFLVKNFAPEARGSGVPEVIDTIYYRKGVIRPVVPVVKFFASALSLGSGGSVGREGPILQIGSAFGSAVGQAVRMPAWQRVALLTAGAGGGISATFNTPLGGMLFAVEIMLHNLSVRSLIPIVVSTIAATYIGRIFFGAHSSFIIPYLQEQSFAVSSLPELMSFGGLGIAAGLASALYIKSIYGFEDIFSKVIKGNYYLRHMAGMLAVGVMIYAMMALTGEYYIEGLGYSTVQEVMDGSLSGVYFLLLLFALKLASTSFTLGSGASGGIFSPALFMGATLGAAYGTVFGHVFPGLHVNPAFYAVAGMAGMVGGSTGAVIAAVVMISEMTLDYNVIIPLAVTVAFSYGVRRVFSRESIYTVKLVRRGHYIPEEPPESFQKAGGQ